MLEEIVDIAKKWRGFGRALHLSTVFLDSTGETNKSDLIECLSAVLDEYLKKNYEFNKHGLPSWRKIVEAISNKVGGNNNDVALRIAKKYSMHRTSYTDFTLLVHILISFHSTGKIDSPDTTIAGQSEATTTTTEIASPHIQQEDDCTSSRASIKNIEFIPKQKFPTGM